MEARTRTWVLANVISAGVISGCSGGLSDAPSDSPVNGPMASDSAAIGTGPGAMNTAQVGTGPGAASATPSGSGPNTTPTSGTMSSASPSDTAGPSEPPPPPTMCVQGIPGTSQIPRLTNVQYERTVRDLLGVTTLTKSGNATDTASILLAADQGGPLTATGWSAYNTVADLISAQVMADPTALAKFMACNPDTDTECLSQTIVNFGRLALRRPLTDVEIASFQKVVTKGTEVQATPTQIAEMLLKAFLVSPSFIQRTEIAGTADAAGHYSLSQFEVASRLSYMLWGSAPDPVLTAAADANALQTPAQILEQATRMVQDAKARDMVKAFHIQLVGMGDTTRWSTPDRLDPMAFPKFNNDQIAPMVEETQRVFEDVVFEQKGGFGDLLTTPVGFVNSATAPLYGLSAQSYGADLEKVTLTDRPGFLTRAAFLTAYTSYSRTNPITRGAFILKEVMGFDPGAPDPEAAKAQLPTGAGLDTNRKQVEELTKNTPCSSCHGPFVNPPGFVMEAFDAAGAPQTVERTTMAPIDSVADVYFDGTPVTVSNPSELMTKIAASPAAQRHYAAKWVSFAYQRDGHAEDVCVADMLGQKMTTAGYTVQNLIADLTQTESFWTRALETEVN